MFEKPRWLVNRNVIGRVQIQENGRVLRITKHGQQAMHADLVILMRRACGIHMNSERGALCLLDL